MKLWMCLVMLIANGAVGEDMTGKVFTFPQESNTAHVRLSTEYQSFSAFTVCHRSFTDLTRDYAIFSVATPSKSNEILTFYIHNNKFMAPHFHDVRIVYGDLGYASNKWHSICTTGDANSGTVRLWFDGQPLTRKFAVPVTGSATTGQPIIILGQDQDNYGGGFDAKQSFVGMMTDVHMWDHELSDCEILKYMDELSFTPGNVINWAALDYTTSGKVLIENKVKSCKSVWVK